MPLTNKIFIGREVKLPQQDRVKIEGSLEMKASAVYIIILCNDTVLLLLSLSLMPQKQQKSIKVIFEIIHLTTGGHPCLYIHILYHSDAYTYTCTHAVSL